MPEVAHQGTGQSVVVHREELLVKARRSCVLPPSGDGPDGNELTLSDVAPLALRQDPQD